MSYISRAYLTDHSKAAAGLAKLGIDIYTSQGTIAACGLTGHRIRRITAFEDISIRSFHIIPFDVKHDAAEPLGFLITSRINNDRLLFISDSNYTRYKFPGLTHIMAECNYDEGSLWRSVEAGHTPPEMVPRIVRSHTSLNTLLKMLRANDLSGVRQVWLMHLSADRSDAALIREAVQRQTGAEVYVC